MTSDKPAPLPLSHPFLRARDGHHARVTNEELFFDLVYVFAVTQVSHGLLHHLTLTGVGQSVVLWLAMWLGWQYTGWFTNWFNPGLPAVRGVLFTTMFLALLAGAAIPGAFAGHGLFFGVAFALMQVGRSGFIVAWLPSGHPLAANYRRILGWMLISAVFWISGGLAGSAEARLALWSVAALCEYVSPMFGFALPGLGRSSARADWTIEGVHLVERCQLFVIVALGETIMASGLSLAGARDWTASYLAALMTGFLTTLAMWWLYFGTSGEDAARAISRSDNPGGLGALIHYLHAALIAGVIVTAVGTDMLIEAPGEEGDRAFMLVTTCGPALYLLAVLAYKRLVSRFISRSHLVGILLLLGPASLILLAPALFPAVGHMPRLETAALVACVMLGVGWGEKCDRSHCPA